MWKRLKDWLGIKSPSEVYTRALGCYLGLHEWDMYAGFHEAKVANGAHCMNCKAPYKEAIKNV